MHISEMTRDFPQLRKSSCLLFWKAKVEQGRGIEQCQQQCPIRLLRGRESRDEKIGSVRKKVSFAATTGRDTLQSVIIPEILGHLTTVFLPRGKSNCNQQSRHPRTFKLGKRPSEGDTDWVI